MPSPHLGARLPRRCAQPCATQLVNAARSMQLHPTRQWRADRGRMCRRLVAHARPMVTGTPCEVYRIRAPTTAHRSTDFRGSGTSVAFPSVGQRGALRSCDRACRDSASASVIAPASGHSRIRVNPAVRVTRVMGWPPPAPPSGLRLESPLGGAVQRALVCRHFGGGLVSSIVIG